MAKEVTEARIACPLCGSEFIRYEKNGKQSDGDPGDCRRCGADLVLRIEPGKMWIESAEQDPE